MDNAAFISGSVGPLSLFRTTPQVTPGTVVSRIETMLELILDCAAAGQELSLDFISRSSCNSRNPNGILRQIKYPGANIHEAKKFARLLLILQLSHDALVSGTILTKRHIYYQHKELFEKQRVVDELVDDVAFTLGANRDDLNIVASAKGVISGPLRFRLLDDNFVDASVGDVGTAIPTTLTISQVDCDAIRWILVVEKDAVFRSLTSASFWQASINGPGIIITAKGYPDMNTRVFLHRLQAKYPQIPMFMLADFDPDGLNIFRCYRYSSDDQSHGSGTAPLNIRLLGIKSQQVLELDTSGTTSPSPFSNEVSCDSQSSGTSKLSISSIACKEPVLSLNQKNRALALAMLEKLSSNAAHDDSEAALMRLELQRMLFIGVKSEIQWLDDAGDITKWLDNKLAQKLHLYDQD